MARILTRAQAGNATLVLVETFHEKRPGEMRGKYRLRTAVLSHDGTMTETKPIGDDPDGIENASQDALERAYGEYYARLDELKKGQ